MPKRTDDPYGIIPATQQSGITNRPQSLPVRKEHQYIDDSLQEHTSQELAKAIETVFAGETHREMTARIVDQTQRGIREIDAIASRPGTEQQLQDQQAIAQPMKAEFAR